MEWGSLYIPADTNSEGTIVPVSAFDQRHLTVDVGAWTIEDIVGMAVAVEGVIVGVVNAAVVGVRVCHCYPR
jgi:hypothetical protein